MNPNTHFYLYAKGWYERNNLMHDLNVLMGQYSGIDPRHISYSDVFQHLTSLAWFEINRSASPEETFKEFAIECQKNNVIQACMALLNMAETKSIDIGRPDAFVLPLSVSGMQDINRPAYSWNQR